RSNAFGLAASGASVVLCGPPTLMPLDLLQAGRTPSLPNVTVEADLDAAIEGADVVMTLRLQSERQEAGMLPSLREYTRRWQVNEARMSRAKPNALLMHPGPMNEGVEIASSLAHGGSSQIEEQVTNGVALRMALLYQLLTGTEERP
ncbi:MAG: aspartate carbamoyltransferase, partial [Chloroflexi bacterium]|nr:aspartate carbamoyltransferase [Chloroflexota bacterium]